MKMFYEETEMYVQILLSFMYFKDLEYFKINLQLREEQCMIPPLHISAWLRSSLRLHWKIW